MSGKRTHGSGHSSGRVELAAQRLARASAATARWCPSSRPVHLLDSYAEHGVSQLDDLGVLQVPPLSSLGSPAEIAGRFGSAGALRTAVTMVGELLYAA